jgi:hypothetical protein
VTDQNRMVELQSIQDLEDIVSQLLVVIASLRPAGHPVTAPGDAIHVAAVQELWSEFVEDVGAVP